MGTAMKLGVNAILGLELQSIAEAIALGEKSGINRDLSLDVLEQTAVIAPAHKPKLTNVRRDKYPAAFSLGLMYKDFELILEYAAQHYVPMPATAIAQQMCAVKQAQSAEDYSVIIRLMEELAGIVRHTSA